VNVLHWWTKEQKYSVLHKASTHSVKVDWIFLLLKCRCIYKALAKYLLINRSATPEHKKQAISKVEPSSQIILASYQCSSFPPQNRCHFTHKGQQKICRCLSLVSTICKLKRASLDIVHNKEHGCFPQALPRSVNLGTHRAINLVNRTKLHGLSPQANYSDLATTACQRS
jgi:hypothetical protein